MLDSMPWLTILAVVPLIGAIILWCIPAAKSAVAPRAALGISLVEFVLLILTFCAFDRSDAGNFQLSEQVNWIPQIGASYAVAVNGVSLLLIALALLLVPLVILAAWKEQGVGSAEGEQAVAAANRLRHYLALVLVLTTFMVLIFAARDVFLFYVVFEAMLVPVYFMIGSFGNGARRRYAAIKFLLYCSRLSACTSKGHRGSTASSSITSQVQLTILVLRSGFLLASSLHLQLRLRCSQYTRGFRILRNTRQLEPLCYLLVF